MRVKIQHQMEVLSPIYMAPNMTALTKMTILNIHFALFGLMKRDIVNRTLPFVKQNLSEWGSRYEAKKLTWGSL